MKITNLVDDMESFFSHAMDAQIEYTLGGLGGCKDFEPSAVPAKFRKYIIDYLETEKGVCACFVEYMHDNGFLYTKE
jgi:hypothetical protein